MRPLYQRVRHTSRSTFTDPRLAAAVVDRLTFNAHILETGTDSYRLRSTRTKKGTATTR
jgi:DNA replication protein DnaC